MAIELSDIIKDVIHKLKLTPYLFSVLSLIMYCRTSILGNHYVQCDNCNELRKEYNSCRNRYCPKCQGSKQIIWKKEKLDELLPVNYSHIVFPIPPILNKLFQYHNNICYDLLFNTVSDTLNGLTSRCSKFKGNIGFMSILHTCTQKLDYYPHIHCLIPEGGLNGNKTEWFSATGEGIFKQKSIEIEFKIRLFQNLEKMFNKEKDMHIDTGLLDKLKKRKCKVFIRSSFKNASEVIDYLGNNIRKTAITNNRIKSYDGNNVTYTYTDRRDGNKEKEITLDAVLFIKKFIMHILPKRYTRIRYYGFLANNCRKSNLEKCMELIEDFDKLKKKLNSKVKDKISKLIENIEELKKCPCCERGILKPLITSTTRYGPK